MDPSNISHQGIASASSLEEVLLVSSTKAQQDKKTMKPPEESLKCPRCDSTNTKFCYYNNYSLSQPRYFCKGCKRYWTQGGTLRNVPVGGGCRKNTKRSSRSSSSSSSSSCSSSKSVQDISTLPRFTYDSHNDLTFAFARLHNQQLGFNDLHNPLYRNYLTSPTTPFDDSVILGVPQYNGFGNEQMGEVLNGSGDGEEAVQRYEEMNSSSTPTATTTTTTKQDFCGGRDGEIINKGYWNNFPWHIGADAGLGLGGVDSGREYWNGLGSSWHGLVNSPLM